MAAPAYDPHAAGRILASPTRAYAAFDARQRVVRTAAAPTGSFVIGDGPGTPNTIYMEELDYLHLYISVALDAGSAVTEVLLTLGKGIGDGVFYQDVALQEELSGANIKANLRPLYYAIPVAAGASLLYPLMIPISAPEVQVAVAADVPGHPDDRVGVLYRRMQRDSHVPIP